MRAPFKAGLFREDGDTVRFLGARCPACGQVHYPRPRACLACGAEGLAEVELGPSGELFSFSVVHMPAAGLKPPFAVGYATLPEGVRIFAPVDAPPDALRVGAPVEARSFVLRREGEAETIAYRFVLRGA
ncbi:MAG: OB-fold domain-containing protein [Deltaproteobacteria bacterium]|nr:OB-fold domain-containing protein [Deltaproteobacteria bacterium]